MHQENMSANQITDHTSYYYIGGEMFTAAKSCHRYCCGGTVNQPFHPRTRVLVGNYACHRPREESVSGGKRAIECIILPESSVTAGLIRAFPARGELQNPVDRDA